jgi:hypothetical protein
LEEIWDLVDKKIKDRQKRYGIEKRLKKSKKVKKRYLASSFSNEDDKNKMILIYKDIKKAKNILENVCKGIFPGDYAIR